ncbi:MAG TPA: sigma-70 family RNA polymerase sigma factor [Pyrinomonadaceae bacterium]
MSVSSIGAYEPEALPVQKKRWTLTQESFDQLLAWLDPNRESAGQTYQAIHSTLMKSFRAHGCAEPEDLADETINRVAGKLPEFVDTYVGDPARYFYRVGHYVHLEYLRRQPEMIELPESMPQREINTDDVEAEYECLDECMQRLTPRSRELVAQYYRGEKSFKIELRKELARQLDTTLPILRVQAHRIRAGLKNCIRDCLSRKTAG